MHERPSLKPSQPIRRNGARARLSRILALGAAMVGIAMLAACGGSGSSGGGTSQTKPTLSSIAVTPAATSVAAGVTAQFVATAAYSDGSKQDVSASASWSSSNTQVATINASGMASTLIAGTTSISASQSGVSGSTPLTVTAATLVSISVTPTSTSLVAGTTQQFSATGVYTDHSTQNLSASVTWTSANPTVASISNAAGSNGLVTASAPGSTAVTAALGGISSAAVTLTVTPATLVALAVTPAAPAVAVGASQPFKATGRLSDQSSKDLTTSVSWNSSNTSVGSISNAAGSAGLATSVAPGRTAVTASLSGITSPPVTLATLIGGIAEPSFPAVCTSLPAPLAIDLSTGDLSAADDTDSNADQETATLRTALAACPSGQAVELIRSGNHSAFLLEPVTIPNGVSLLVDGGVTVFASRNPTKYQSTSSLACGSIATADGGCVALLTFGSNSGLYGYGVVDGRGYATMTGGPNAGKTWWSNILNSTSTTHENNPYLIHAIGSGTSGAAFTLYKITLRNAAFWHVRWDGQGQGGLVVWGLKVQSPWVIANTDGIDVYDGNGVIVNSTFSEGDDDIAIDSENYPVSNVIVDGVTIYNRNGVSIGSHTAKGVSNVTVENTNLSADPLSVTSNSVNGVTLQALLQQGISIPDISYALPMKAGAIRGLNIKLAPPTGAISNITFENICMKGLNYPITIAPYIGVTTNPAPTAITSVLYQNIHVLASSVPAPNTPPQKFQFDQFTNGPAMQLAFNNVVVDPSSATPAAISNINAQNLDLTLSGTISPAVFGQLGGAATNYQGTALDLANVTVSGQASASASGAYVCPVTSFPYLVGDLYVSTGSQSNLQQVTVPPGAPIVLNAVVSPAMSQLTLLAPGDYGKQPGLVAVGSPAVTGTVQFYEGQQLLGTAPLNADGSNGTIAALTITAPSSSGVHTYRASYQDSNYSQQSFGPVVVQVQ
jgi:hypothetical protein